MKLFNKIAYHSTTQKGLDKFENTTSKKNAFTGEGAMVHGWGLYLQADKEINTKRYKESLSENDEIKHYVIKINDDVYDITDESDSILTVNGVRSDDKVLNSVIWALRFGEDINHIIDKLNRYVESMNSYVNSYELDSKTSDKYRRAIVEEEKEMIKVLTEWKDKNISVTSYLEDRRARQYTVEIPDDFEFLDEDSYAPESLVDEVADYYGFYTDKQFMEDAKKVQEQMSKDYPMFKPETWEPQIRGGAYEPNKDNILRWMLKLNRDVLGLSDEEISDIKVLDKIHNFEKGYYDFYKAMISFTQSEAYERRFGMTNHLYNSGLFAHRDMVGGRELYELISKCTGDDEYASRWLLEHGIDGIHYHGDMDGECWVIFNCSNLYIIKEE